MIRYATNADLPGIVEIYNQAILAKFQTADTGLFTVEEKEGWFNSHDTANYPILVEEQDGMVRGWLSVSAYRPGRKALKGCVEVSYYVNQSYLRQGIGSSLLSSALEFCRAANYHTIITIILDRNQQSIQLMEKFGFSRWGHLPGIANFDGERCGHVYYGLQLQ